MSERLSLPIIWRLKAFGCICDFRPLIGGGFIMFQRNECKYHYELENLK